MKKILGVWLVLAVLNAFAWGGEPGEGTKGGGSGNEVPVPFTVENLKVELADGEPYALLGRVLIVNMQGDASTTGGSQAFFEVDLASHPWLASSYRKEHPQYALEGPVSRWNTFTQVPRVRLKATAFGKIVVGREGQSSYQIVLRATEEPAEAVPGGSN